MASNFSFQSFGLSQRITVLASAGTISMTVVRSGGTTLSVSSVSNAQYPPSVIRVSNNNPVSVFLQPGDSTVTVGVNTGMEILPNSVETFKVVGTPFLAYISNGTATIGITPGEGL